MIHHSSVKSSLTYQSSMSKILRYLIFLKVKKECVNVIARMGVGIPKLAHATDLTKN